MSPDNYEMSTKDVLGGLIGGLEDNSFAEAMKNISNEIDEYLEKVPEEDKNETIEVGTIDGYDVKTKKTIITGSVGGKDAELHIEQTKVIGKCIVVICIQVFIVQIVLSPVSYGKSAPSNGTEEDEGPRNSSTNPGRKSTVGKALADLIKAIFRLIRVEIKSTEDLVPDFEADPNRDPMSLPFITIENVNGTMVATSRDVNIYHAIKEVRHLFPSLSFTKLVTLLKLLTRFLGKLL
ncbi:hypothetical protein KP79_PYT03192 [Mizuhopecten yessoensis]|uniref:Uncharacterized protein n=1 Tax=Mizuhopecten yessoensis TaxID=6573 RepID=A0A210PJ39_MIZYE|nr:hypothetical protein KP79_PYT03192 [Mizuhopecten yessoensis]